MLLYGIALLLTVFGSLFVLALAGEACERLLYLACYVLLTHFCRLLSAALAVLLLVASAGVLLSLLSVVLLGCGCYIHTLLGDALALLACAARISIAVVCLLFALLAALLLTLLLRAGALVQCIEVYLSEHVHLRRKLLLALQREYF